MRAWHLWFPVWTAIALAVLPALAAAALDGERLKAPDGVEIAYSVQGQGDPALVFIHGGYADRHFWDNQIEPFSKKFRVIALDLPGHGEAGQNRVTWSLPIFGLDIKTVLQKEKVGAAVLIGNSLGGPIALEAARLLPGVVRGVVAVDTFQSLTQKFPAEYARMRADSFRRDFTGTMRGLVNQLFHSDADPRLKAWAEERMMRCPVEMAAAVQESLAGYDLGALAKSVKVPIRCLNGDLFPSDIAGSRAFYGDYQAVVMPHTGHYPMLEKPEEFNRHLADILAELTKSK